MLSKINQLLKKIDDLKLQVQLEYELLMERYDFEIQNRKIVFSEKAKELQKRAKEGVFHYLLSAEIRHLLSAPFIYAMIVPAIILDLFLTGYQHTAFRLYGIERVRRRDHIVFDRKYLGYLNSIEKFNCLYCSYVNGLFSYATEIGGRTERYWCPIKYARRLEQTHRHYAEFADFGDAEGFRERYAEKGVDKMR
ncbi:MAG: hypothetical protein QG650_586 [Patescibacteria group bacterium]|nr:hypothetical protein [Patescibacteria group bacterium]